MSTPQPPSADQLAAARLAHWRQNTAEGADGSAVALLTLESARHFVSSCGLLLFAPRPQHIASPAPSFVEATLGVSNSSPSLAESATARTLLARLVAEGTAVPLNLLGAPSTTPDAPDFIASTATFSYIFTLRGDKAFKQPPSTSGATKVSPLSLNTYTLLVENGPRSASDLAADLGKEITEAAVLRSLNELWQHLRVLPVPLADGGPTLWETVAHRFTKQLKAGANAGQPSALSALISLYLSQSLLASETEIETFLSPLAPRSRVRDVLHALTGARQIETIAVEGKTLLHIHGDLPTFASEGVLETSTEADIEPASESASVDLAEDGTRIRKFIPKPRKVGTGYVERAKPFGNTGRPPREGRPGFDRQGPSRDRPARPFTKSSDRFAGRPSDRPARPSFNKPWDEEKQQRAAREAAEAPSSAAPGDQQFQDVDLDAQAAPPPRPSRPFADRSRPGGNRPAYPRKSGPGGGDRPAFSRKPSFGGDRPAYGRNRDASSEGRPPRRDFAPREGGDSRPPRREFSGGSRPPFGERRPFSKGGFGARSSEASTEHAGRPDRPAYNRPSFGDRSAGDKERRPSRRDQFSGEGRPPRREFTPRTEGDSRPPRREFTPREGFGGRPPREGFSKPRAFRDRESSGGEAQGGSGRPERPAFRKFDAPRGPRPPFPPREGGDSRPPRRDFSSSDRPSFGPRKPFTKSGPGTGSGSREGAGGYAGKREGAGGYAGKREGAGGYAGKREGAGGFAPRREGGGYAGKKPFGAKSAGFAGKKPFAAKPAGRRGADAPGASTFDKFKGGNKPWGKRPPGRKAKPEGGEA